MPFPQGSERIFYGGNTRPLPVPLSRGQIDIGYIEAPKIKTIEGPRTETAKVTYIPVTHALTDRTFTYRALISVEYELGGQPTRSVDYDDVRALFIPKNKFRPNLNRGEWYYGREMIVNYLTTQGDEDILGLLFVDQSATVGWTGEGLDAAQQLQHIMRPQLSPRDATPVDFRGIFDESCPDTCDID